MSSAEARSTQSNELLAMARRGEPVVGTVKAHGPAKYGPREHRVPIDMVLAEYPDVSLRISGFARNPRPVIPPVGTHVRVTMVREGYVIGIEVLPC